jgi:hypothetical protein
MRTENMTTQPNAHSGVIVINGTHFVQGRNNGYLTKNRWGCVLLILYVSVQLPPSSRMRVAQLTTSTTSLVISTPAVAVVAEVSGPKHAIEQP